MARHQPDHIYFTGRNAKAAAKLITDIKSTSPSVELTFMEMDMTSLVSVKSAVDKVFSHDRLDVLMCNAGVMAQPPAVSKDGFELQFAINHLGNAMVLHRLLPVLSRTAEQPESDVRVICLTSDGWRAHPRGGIAWDKLRTTGEAFFMGSWLRYG